MKRFIFVTLLLVSAHTMASSAMVCKQYGYAATAEDFHSIKMEASDNTFLISKDKVSTKSGRLYQAVDPETVGFDHGTPTYLNEGSGEVLYLYQRKRKNEIGISTLIPDSDAGFLDKELYSDCHFEPTKGNRHGVAGTSFDLEAGRAKATETSWRF
jgi:hypothetical protein